jgi:hypothetical protein
VRAVRAVEAVCLGRQTHLLRERQTGARDIKQGVFFFGIERNVVLAAHRGIDELDFDTLVPTPSM